MRTSTESEVAAKRFGNERGVRILAEAGFDCYDYSMFTVKRGQSLRSHRYLADAQKLRRAADDCGIACNQSHAPFPSFKQGNARYNRGVFTLLVRALETTAALGGGICVIHPASLGERTLETNLELYNRLLPYARDFRVKIALENMWTWPQGSPTAQPGACATPESFLAHLNALDAGWFTACLDMGHAEMAGTGSSAVELIRALGSKLGALHVHDNDLIHDSHTLPYQGLIQWPAVLQALGETGYSGDFTLEADAFLYRVPDDLLPQALRMMSETARWMADKIYHAQ